MSSAPDPVAGLRRRLERERAARREAESIAERVTGDLYRVNSELQALNESLREFVAVAAHDLRGPLTSLMGLSTTLSRRWADLNPDARAEMFATIERQGQRLRLLTDDLLTISKIDAGALETIVEVVALRDVIREVTADFGERSGDIQVLAGDLRAAVDPVHLQRILTNYLGNAFRYGSPPIEVHARDAGSWVEILIRDCGAGVPEELVPRLFGKFVRGEQSHLIGGTGLGLSIVRGLAKANGGDTWYEPNHPHGSCFGVRLRKRVA
jgi:signal transduction histidine kinase